VTTKTLSELYASLLMPQTPLSPIGTFSPSQGRTALLALLAKPSAPLQPANTLSALRMFSPLQPAERAFRAGHVLRSCTSRGSALRFGISQLSAAPVDRRYAAVYPIPPSSAAHAGATHRWHDEAGRRRQLPQQRVLRQQFADGQQLLRRLLGQGYGYPATSRRRYLFPTPAAVYNRFQGYIWNRQSALLQEVRTTSLPLIRLPT